MRLGRYELALEPRQTLPPIYTALIAVGAIVLALALASVLFVSAHTLVASCARPRSKAGSTSGLPTGASRSS